MAKYKAGTYIEQIGYKSYSPSYIDGPFEWTDKRIDILLGDAMRYLGELNAYSKLVPDIDFFIQMYVAKEATKSNRIEGTKTNLNEALLPEVEVKPEMRDDWSEVQNYIKAINFAIDQLSQADKPPFSIRLIREAHKILLDNVRGYIKLPGEVRKSQNWIGGSTLKDAAFIPPHYTVVPELLHDLEKFLHNKVVQVPDLIRTAIGHYQFETIHPFLDGNGRIGRLMITLHLVSLGILNKPTLYLSDYFEKNRSHYYDALSRVRESNDLEHWLRFFLTGVVQTAKEARETLEKIIDLRAKYERVIMDGMGIKRQKLARELLNKLYSRPIVTIREMMTLVPMTYTTAAAITKDFERLGIFTEKTGRRKDRIFYLREYLDLFNN